MKTKSSNSSVITNFVCFITIFSFAVQRPCCAQISFITNTQELNDLAGRGVALADLNSDGNPDAFVVNEDGPEGNGYRVYFGDGQGMFTAGISLINQIPNTSQPVIADIDGDGQTEVITGATVWINDGHGVLTPDTSRFEGVQGISFNDMKLADFNGDGSLDVFVTVYSTNVSHARVYLNDGHGHFTDTGQQLGHGKGIYYPVVLDDLNGDEFIDAATSGWRNNVDEPCPNRIWLNDGKGNFTETGQILDEGLRHSHGLASGDFDGDGDPDLVIAMQSSPFTKIYLNDGTGYFTAGQMFGSKHVEKVFTDDLNGDRNPDIFLACNGANEIWLNNGQAHFVDSGLRLGSEWSWNAALGDLNNDNRLDVFAVNFGPEFKNNVFTAHGRLAEVWLNTKFQCDYLGENPPGNTPVLFGKGTVSVAGENTHACSFSPDGRFLIFSRYPERKSYVMTYTDSQWTGPTEAFFDGKETSFSPYGDKVYYYKGKGDIYYNQKTKNGWSSPMSVGSLINTSETEYYPSITNDGTLFFSRNGKWDQGRIMYSIFSKRKFNKPVDIGLPVNDGGALHAWVAPDKSYMLFNSPRPGSYTKLDIWISYRKNNGTWTNPQNLGETINSGADAILCPTVTPDGKFMFFTKLDLSTNTGNIYWVSAAFINSLRNTNNSPLINH